MRAAARLTVVLIVVLAAVPATAGKIGFLDGDRAATTVQEGRSQLQALESWAKPRRDQLEQLQAQVNGLKQRLATQQSVASAEALAALERELLQAQRGLEDQARAFNRELNARQDKIVADIGAKIGKLATEYAEANDFDVIFLLAAQPVAYFATSLNITDAIIRLYDERYPAD
ncbi:MAG TPA: OmpH family outer membrane protein [Thermoanaerobaculales bacterium]|nr:OmpH family outer membrane protein [Thermoanaerobaculales bacterium]HPA79751.1 OmpH family outer membrane protein [Thermoanaerobaculales bacterium]HQL29383.1 OmpH family outer membrane protein [Thermoanaerobaculales bacterium]HQN96065.1 OmpH family outer membrane protein [Thermoanaerobaculales bacterium]HQP42685.1 OmpH family outer membrane protein [Thermoanaerobaculales bacterium]